MGDGLNSQQTIMIMIGVCVAVMAVMIFIRQIKVLGKIILRSGIGILSVWIINHFTLPFGLIIGLNFINALFIGILGIPGIITLYAAQWFL